MNGDEGVAIPGRTVGASHFKDVYSHPAANGRSRGAALSDLFWYWLSPGPELHQEHLEPGPRYDEVARTTRRLLARPHAAVEALAADCTARVLDERPVTALRLVRLRNLMMPIWAEFAYELVFGERCPRRARELIVGNANDVVTALKCTGLRHMGRRHRLTEYLVDRLEHGPEPQQPLPGGLSTRERALYLQGTFFNTAVVQTSEAMAHLLMVLAQHRDVQERAAAAPDDVRHLDRVLDETMRLYPLFGIAHRITSADITVGERTIPRGSVLCFNYPAYHRTGYDDPDAFRPERWEGALAPRRRLHPVRRRRQPPVPGARDRAGRDASGDARGAAALRARLLRLAHALDPEPRAVHPRRARGPARAAAAPAPAAGVRACSRPLGGRLAQPRPARARNLHGVGRAPAPPVRAPLRRGQISPSARVAAAAPACRACRWRRPERRAPP